MRLTAATARELAFEAGLFAAGAAELALCHRHALALTALLLVTALCSLAFWRQSHLVWIYVLGGIIGPCGEIFGVLGGAWQYAEPAFLGIPLWLPFAWGLAAVLVKTTADTVQKLAARP